MFDAGGLKLALKKFLPSAILIYYHRLLAAFYAGWYGHPSRRLVVIGVTGTNGKSSTVSFISQLLTAMGRKTGYASTAEFKVGDRIVLNDQKMTMLGRGKLQRLLREMVEQKTEYAVIETSSEGIAQSRHRGIDYDMAVFTNLTPEHLEAHGGFANYKAAKLALFSYLSSRYDKFISGKKISKSIIVNADDKYADEFLNFPVAKKIRYSVRNDDGGVPVDLVARQVRLTATATEFIIGDCQFYLPVPGRFNLYNCLAAIAVLSAFGWSLKKISPAVAKLKSVPGRLEFINAGQPFKVMVDYAYEPVELAALYDALSLFSFGRLLHVLGSAGGGRDKSRRKILGQMAGRRAAVVIVTNEDPYDEDPEEIIKAVATGAEEVGKKLNDDLLMVSDRKEAIATALERARPGDLVLITGKGSEQAIVGSGGRKLAWDDRAVVKELLPKIVASD